MESVTPPFAHQEFIDPLPDEYLYLGLSVDPPAHTPVVRPSTQRDRVLARCRDFARDLESVEGLVETTVFEAVLIPPLNGVPRFDVTLLIRAATADAMAQVRNADLGTNQEPDFVMAARNIRRIGDTERTRSATFLFNHFTAPDTLRAVNAFEQIAGWYTAKLGVDNATLLQPTGEAPYAFVNYVRLPHGGVRFLVDQISKPSFHTFVRRTLKDNDMVALPLLCKPV